MPIYDMECENCGFIEIEHSIHKNHPKKCPECKKGKIHVVFLSHALVKLKGRGWTTKYDGGVQPATSEEAKVPYN